MFTLTGKETIAQQLLKNLKQLYAFLFSRKNFTNTNSVSIASSACPAKESAIPVPLYLSAPQLLKMFMENSQAGCYIYDENDMIVFANAAYTEGTSFSGNPEGKHISAVFPGAVAEKLILRNKEIFQSGQASTSEHSYIKADGSRGYFISTTFVFEGAGGKRYIGGQAIDITDRKLMEKTHERYKYVINATSEAIWDFDVTNNEIYRSDTFYKISGYPKGEVINSLDWWITKIHPEDKERVNRNVAIALSEGRTNWQDEYRFMYADGTYRYILDKGFALYDNGKPIRLIGSIQDITDRKMLEKQLLDEQVQKQKLINQATIDAQEKERGMISAELHDNVNQLLMSARLHVNAAKNNENANELIGKASDYLLMAVEEIRGLSHRLNSSIVKTVGLEACIEDICRNLQQFGAIEVTADIQPEAVACLSQEQQLVIFRIVQEQSSNIIKYAQAAAVNITLTNHHTYCTLAISDDGVGFDKAKQKANGIGFINIFNRVDAYNGKAEIITFPGNGCTLSVTMPYLV